MELMSHWPQWPPWPPCNSGVLLSEGFCCSPNWNALSWHQHHWFSDFFLCLCSMKLLLIYFLKLTTQPNLPPYPLLSLSGLLILITFLNMFYFLLVYYICSLKVRLNSNTSAFLFSFEFQLIKGIFYLLKFPLIA